MGATHAPPPAEAERGALLVGHKAVHQELRRGSGLARVFRQRHNAKLASYLSAMSREEGPASEGQSYTDSHHVRSFP